MGLKPGLANCGQCGPSPQPVVNDLLSCFKWLRKIKRIIFYDSENYMKQNFSATQINFFGIFFSEMERSSTLKDRGCGKCKLF